ncbi:MAG TPA: LysR family transcriptional regulator [Ramlibacter sp.]|nr:LysR family transcriptional regulator [Ramlibacter sp.]
MDRFFAMSAFVRVVEAGSFTKAAETMDLPKPTVTRLIQGLERELRVRLLDRTTRSVTVTAEGATYYERVVRLLADLSDIESTAKQSIARPSGRLRVDVATAIATSVLIPALPDFYRAYPEIELDLGITNRYVDLVAENVDCAIRVGSVEEQFVVARRVGEFRFVTCASPAYLSAVGTPAAPGELEGRHRLLGLVSTRTGKAIAFRFAKEGEDLEVAPDPRFSVDDTNAYLVAGTAGLGILQAPAYMVDPAIRSGQLTAVLRDWTTPPVPVHVLYRPNRFLGAKVRVFIDWTIALFERHPHLKPS